MKKNILLAIGFWVLVNVPLQAANHPSTNGTAEVSHWDSRFGFSGTLYAGKTIKEKDNITQVILATVTRPGSYSLSCSSNGVTFSAAGIFPAPGKYPVTLLASGQPTNTGSDISYDLNTLPSTHFIRTILSLTSNGTAVLSNLKPVAQTIDDDFSKQKLKVNVSVAGTYSLSTFCVNGVSFVAEGIFTEIGPQEITLQAIGTPILSGCYIYSFSISPAISFDKDYGP